MNAADQAIAARLRGLDLEQLRVEHERVFGEPNRGGAEYLRKKIALALIEAGERTSRLEAAEEPPVGVESRAEKLCNEAIDCEIDEDLEGAAEKWAAAALASKSRKKEYTERSAKCRAEAAKRRPQAEPEEDELVDEMPEESDEGGAHVEHLEAANAAEAEGNLKGAAVEWELAAGKVRGPLRDTFLARAEQLRQLQPKVPAGTKSLTLPGRVETIENTITIAKEKIAAAGLDQAPTQGEVFDRLVAGASAVGPSLGEALDQVLGEQLEQEEAVDRDPRLPAAGTTLRKDLRSGGFVEIKFGGGAAVELVSADVQGAELIGKTFASISGLARAYCGRNTNGYVWLNLKAPPTDATLKAKRTFTVTVGKNSPTAEAYNARQRAKGAPVPTLVSPARGPDQAAGSPSSPAAASPRKTMQERAHELVAQPDAAEPVPVLWAPGALRRTAQALLLKKMGDLRPDRDLGQLALAIAARRTSELFAELADILENG